MSNEQKAPKAKAEPKPKAKSEDQDEIDYSPRSAEEVRQAQLAMQCVDFS